MSVPRIKHRTSIVVYVLQLLSCSICFVPAPANRLLISTPCHDYAISHTTHTCNHFSYKLKCRVTSIIVNRLDIRNPHLRVSCTDLLITPRLDGPRSKTKPFLYNALDRSAKFHSARHSCRNMPPCPPRLDINIPHTRLTKRVVIIAIFCLPSAT